MPRNGKGARLWLRPARRRGNSVANAVWIIIDGSRHIATGCVKSQAREAEKRLAAYIAEKYSPTCHARDIDRIDVADVLSIYFDDCGPRITDQLKLQRTIGRLNEFWGGKMLSQVSAAECRSYVKERGKTGGARADLETLARRDQSSRQGKPSLRSCTSCPSAKRTASRQMADAL
jgi:hypothetical protein